jgi:tetratricopeptide (TPR) repeat protein
VRKQTHQLLSNNRHYLGAIKMKGLKKLVPAIVLFVLTMSIPHANAEITSQKNQQPAKSQITPAQSTNNNQDTRAKLKQAYNLFFKTKNYQAALQLFNEIIEVEPNNQYAYLGRGASNYELRNYKAAKADLDKTIQLDSNIHFAYLYRGICNYALGNKNDAIADLQIAANLFEKDGDKNMAQTALKIINQIRNA